MNVVYGSCAGLDVHKETVAVCVLKVDAAGRRGQEVRTFGTTTGQLLALSDWLGEEKVTHLAMESTGVFWKPVFYILEARFEVLLVNARAVKQVPGRKTDVKDCEWIAQLLQHGLLKASFIPPRPQRELRDLTRHRVQLVGEHTRVANRIHKVLEDANIKLGSVATDILGVSGREMIQRLIAGQDDAQEVAELARGRLRSKRDQLVEALQGHVTGHHRFMLRMLWEHLHYLEQALGALEDRIEEAVRPFAEEVERLETIPGVGRQVACALVGEIGVNMGQFPSAGHLASWAGMCPGNHESAGKRKSGKTPKGNRWLRRCLAEASWGAAHTKDTYLSAQFRRIARRRGSKRAIVAVGHSILVIAYHLLGERRTYEDLGADHFDRLHPERLRRYHQRRLEELGYTVQLTPATTAA